MDYLITRDEGSQAIAHHGIKGQKHGIRRYQNEDGSYTQEGRERYGIGDGREKSNRTVSDDEKNEYNRLARRVTAGGLVGFENSSTKGRFLELGNKIKSAQWQEEANNAKGSLHQRYAQKKSDKYARRAEAQARKNADRDDYKRRTSTGKQVVQKVLLGYNGGEAYIDAKSSGSTRGRAAAEALLSGTMVGSVLRNTRDKKKYGDRVL